MSTPHRSVTIWEPPAPAQPPVPEVGDYVNVDHDTKGLWDLTNDKHVWRVVWTADSVGRGYRTKNVVVYLVRSFGADAPSGLVLRINLDHLEPLTTTQKDVL